MKLGKIICLLVIISCSINVSSQPYLNVKDFGAKGDGQTDDSKSIQAAIISAQKSTISTNNIADVYASGMYLGAQPTVFFPLGIYKVSKSIELGTYARIVGDKAIIIPFKNFNGNAVESSSWQLKIEGLQFVGFRGIAINVKNGTLESGKIDISDCDFYSNSTAISLDAGNSLGIIQNNRFIYNQKVLISNCNISSVFNNWIEAGTLKGIHDAQIVNYGIMTFNENQLIPMPPQANASEPAWINNYNNISVENVRQGGEPGSFTLINNFAKADVDYPIWPTSVSIKNSDCYAIYGNTKEYQQPTALRLIELPNAVILEDLRGFVDSRVVDISKQMQSAVKSKLSKSNMSLRISNIVGGASDLNVLPVLLSKFLVH